jgi:hypothetical protein
MVAVFHCTAFICSGYRTGRPIQLTKEASSLDARHDSRRSISRIVWRLERAIAIHDIKGRIRPIVLQSVVTGHND